MSSFFVSPQPILKNPYLTHTSISHSIPRKTEGVFMMPIDLYCMALQDRSDRVRWLLEELGVPYKDHFLNRKNGDLQNPSYLQLNPMGRVPTIKIGRAHV